MINWEKNMSESRSNAVAYSEMKIEISFPNERRAALERLEAMIKPIPELDEKAALAEWREEKFSYADSD